MALEEMDGSFGAITQTIKNLGIDNNTIIVFTSDNGLVFLLGQLSWVWCNLQKTLFYAFELQLVV